MMPTLFLNWDGDMIASQQGGLVLASGWDEIRQRIERRILTNPQRKNFDGTIQPAGYIYHPDYGLGLQYIVCEALSDDMVSQLEQKITQGILEDVDVDETFLPEITVDRPNRKTVVIDALLRLKTGLNQNVVFVVAEQGG